MDTVLRDQEVAELWVADRLTRVATHSLFRCLISQLESRVSEPVRRGLLPADLRVTLSFFKKGSRTLLCTVSLVQQFARSF